ncbi:hypothetical protein C0214_19660 [Methylobacterium sp. DM1]|nr:hypothetical protein C0214_19660 [Methylobacterium sp. DM1]
MGAVNALADVDIPAPAIDDVSGLLEVLDEKANAADLGNAAARNVGAAPGTVAAGDDERIVGALPSSAVATNVLLSIPEDLRADVLAGRPTRDLSPEINSAVALSQLTGINAVYFPGRSAVYRHDLGLSFTSSMTIYGDGGKLDCSRMPAGTSLSQIVGVSAKGTVQEERPITADVPANTNVLLVASTAGLFAGDIVLIQSNEFYDPGVTGVSNRRGELAKILKVDSGTKITIDKRVYFSYASASAARLSKVVPVKFSVRNLGVTMGGVGKVHTGFEVMYGERLVFEDAYSLGAEDNGINLAYCYGADIVRGSHVDCTSPNNGPNKLGNTGYGVAIGSACRDIFVNRAYFKNCRHGVAGGGVQPSIFAKAADCLLDNCGGAAGGTSLDCHEPCFEYEFIRNHVTGGTGPGILVRGQRCRVVGNIVQGCAAQGIWVHSFIANTSGVGDHVIEDNQVYDCNSVGISLDGDADTARIKRVKVRRNKVVNTKFQNISASYADDIEISKNDLDKPYLTTTGTGGQNIRLYGTDAALSRCNDVKLEDNKCRGGFREGIRAEFVGGRLQIVPDLAGATREPLFLVSCDDVAILGGTIRSDTVLNGASAITASNPGNLRVVGTAIIGTGMAQGATGQDGIRITAATGSRGRCTVTGSSMTGFRYGAYQDSGAASIFTSNDAGGCTGPGGIYMRTEPAVALKVASGNLPA